jgi:hypothetical protein
MRNSVICVQDAMIVLAFTLAMMAFLMLLTIAMYSIIYCTDLFQNSHANSVNPRDFQGRARPEDKHPLFMIHDDAHDAWLTWVCTFQCLSAAFLISYLYRSMRIVSYFSISIVVSTFPIVVLNIIRHCLPAVAQSCMNAYDVAPNVCVLAYQFIVRCCAYMCMSVYETCYNLCCMCRVLEDLPEPVPVPEPVLDGPVHGTVHNQDYPPEQELARVSEPSSSADIVTDTSTLPLVDKSLVTSETFRNV